MNAMNPTDTRPLAARAAKGSAWLVASRLGTRAIDFVTLLVLARLLTPADFGVVAVALFSAIATYLITRLADMLVGLRVDLEHETLGLDFATHGESGYHMNR